MLAARAGGPVDDGVAEHLVSVTDGNPVALVELPWVLTNERLRGTAPRPDHLPIGDRPARLFTARVGLLDTAAQMVLLVGWAEGMGI